MAKLSNSIIVHKHKGWRRYLMASIDPLSAKREGITDIQLKRKANDRGYRTYRISLDGTDLQPDEIMCPHITHGTQCVDCGLCDGSRGATDRRKNIVSILHGSPTGISTTLKKIAN
jgi:hypothetical protein